MKIQNKLNSLYKTHIKGKKSNIILIMCISGFMFGFFFGYLLMESEKIEVMKELETSTQNNNKEDPIVKISKEVSPSIVVVKNKVYDKKGNEKILVDKGIGSGIIYKKNGYIITNQHVVRDASAVTILLNNGEEYDAKVIGEDSKTDLAVVKIEKGTLNVGKFGNSDKLKIGQKAIAIGSPIGQEFSGSVTSGIISALNRSIDIRNKRMNLIQTDAAINPGNSGGALLNENGEIIGINSMKISVTGIEGMAFAIPINDGIPIIEELIKNGYIKRPWLGLGLADVTKDLVEKYNIPEGVYIGSIAKDSPAYKSDITKNDIIIKVNNNRIRSVAELGAIIDKYNPNHKVKVTVFRKGKEIDCYIILGETPKSSLF